MTSLRRVMKNLEHEEPLSPKLKDHALTGNWKNYRELHIYTVGHN